MIWKQFLYNFLVLLNGPVQNALFCLMDRYRNVCVWFMARNCRFPEVGTPGSQPGNQRLPLQGTAGSHRLEVMVPKPGDQMLPLQATAGSQRLELMVPNLGTIGYHGKELPVPRPWNLRFPTWEPKVTMARNCSQRLELTVANVGTTGYHCKELPVPRGWNSWFPNLGTMGYHCKQLPVTRGWNSCFPTWEP